MVEITGKYDRNMEVHGRNRGDNDENMGDYDRNRGIMLQKYGKQKERLLHL